MVRPRCEVELHNCSLFLTKLRIGLLFEKEHKKYDNMVIQHLGKNERAISVFFQALHQELQ